MLAFPGAPAVLSLHVFSYWYTKEDPDDPASPALWHRTGEDDLAVIAQYYDVPVLSLRWARGGWGGVNGGACGGAGDGQAAQLKCGWVLCSTLPGLRPPPPSLSPTCWH
jgi:hypothetical protein